MFIIGPKPLPFSGMCAGLSHLLIEEKRRFCLLFILGAMQKSKGYPFILYERANK